MQVAMIPVGSLRHVPGKVVSIGVGHSRRNVQQHVVGISLRTDVKSVGVKIDRRRGHLLRIDRDGLTLGRVLRTEVVPDGQAGEAVLEMNDQPLAGKYLQGRRRIEIAARSLPIRGLAANQLIVEEEKVLDRRSNRIQRGLPLSRAEPDFEHAILARQRDRFSKQWSIRRICSSLARLRPRCLARTFECRQDGEHADYYQAEQAACAQRAVHGKFAHKRNPERPVVKLAGSKKDSNPLIAWTGHTSAAKIDRAHKRSGLNVAQDKHDRQRRLSAKYNTPSAYRCLIGSN